VDFCSFFIDAVTRGRASNRSTRHSVPRSSGSRFQRFGTQAIALVREKKPEVYMRVVADLLPKEANINVEAGEAFVNLWRRISEGFGDELAECFEPSEGRH
jgi:hypothetical protein